MQDGFVSTYVHYSVRDLQSISGCLYGIAMDIVEVHSGTTEHVHLFHYEFQHHLKT